MPASYVLVQMAAYRLFLWFKQPVVDSNGKMW